MRHPLLSVFVGTALVTLATAASAATPPPGVTPEAVAAVCGELLTATDCGDCNCEIVGTSDGPGVDREAQPATAFALLMRVSTPVETITPDRALPVFDRYHVVVGDGKTLSNAGLVANGDSTHQRTTYTSVKVHKSQQFNDICLRCDHENAGLVHLFDLETEQKVIVERENYEMWATTTVDRSLISCFGRETTACYATPLGQSTQESREPQAPGDRPKPGKKLSWKRSWKIGGRNAMQVVLGAPSGNAAAKLKGSPITTDLREFNFTDLPTRGSAAALKR